MTTREDRKTVLVTGASGYVASQMLPEFRRRYDLRLVDVTDHDRDGNLVEGVEVVDLIDPDRDHYHLIFFTLEVGAGSVDSYTSFSLWDFKIHQPSA